MLPTPAVNSSKPKNESVAVLIKDKREFKMLSRFPQPLYGTLDWQFNKANKEGVQDERGHSLGFSGARVEGRAVNTRGSERKKRVN